MIKFSAAQRAWLLLSCIGVTTASLGAQTVDRIAEREIAKRQAAIPRGEEIVARAQVELKAKEFDAAHTDFKMALTYLPDGASTSRSHEVAMSGFCESG